MRLPLINYKTIYNYNGREEHAKLKKQDGDCKTWKYERTNCICSAICLQYERNPSSVIFDILFYSILQKEKRVLNMQEKKALQRFLHFFYDCNWLNGFGIHAASNLKS